MNHPPSQRTAKHEHPHSGEWHEQPSGKFHSSYIPTSLKTHEAFNDSHMVFRTSPSSVSTSHRRNAAPSEGAASSASAPAEVRICQVDIPCASTEHRSESVRGAVATSPSGCFSFVFFRGGRPKGVSGRQLEEAEIMSSCQET